MNSGGRPHSVTTVMQLTPHNFARRYLQEYAAVATEGLIHEKKDQLLCFFGICA